MPNQVPELTYMYIVGLIGLFAGGIASYITNLLLADEGFIADPQVRSYCGHKDSLFDVIPFVSLLLLDGKCINCRRRVKWQYPFVQILMAIFFCVVFWRYGLGFYSAGMMFFVAVLVAICITDFKAKIIPHELTYPAIILGIVFSALTKADVLGALAGIGVSYILFDFLAFYGLKIFLWFNNPSLSPGVAFLSLDKSKAQVPKKLDRGFSWASKEASCISTRPKNKEYFSTQLYSKGLPLEELEVIGGGDAVLSALISAWLGWRKLILALVLGFLIGTVLGAIYVLIDLKKERLLGSLLMPVIACTAGLTFFATCVLFILAVSLKESVFLMPYQYILPGAALVGSLLGVIVAGSRTSKPFPFGPALAMGAAIAIFRRD